MTKEQLIGRILNSTPDELARVAGVFTGQAEETPSFRLVKMGEAAAALGVSRVTLWRLVKEGRVSSVEVRRGSHRIPESELRRFVAGGNLH